MNSKGDNKFLSQSYWSIFNITVISPEHTEPTCAKCKVKLFMYNAMDVEVKLHIIYTSVLDGVELSASHSNYLIPSGTDPRTHWKGGWVSLTFSLHVVVKRKISAIN
jgi:hypothetical protein